MCDWLPYLIGRFVYRHGRGTFVLVVLGTDLSEAVNPCLGWAISQQDGILPALTKEVFQGKAALAQDSLMPQVAT